MTKTPHIDAKGIEAYKKASKKNQGKAVKARASRAASRQTQVTAQPKSAAKKAAAKQKAPAKKKASS